MDTKNRFKLAFLISIIIFVSCISSGGLVYYLIVREMNKALWEATLIDGGFQISNYKEWFLKYNDSTGEVLSENSILKRKIKLYQKILPEIYFPEKDTVMGQIYFDTNDASLTENAKEILEKFAVFLNDTAHIVQIEGYSDKRGSKSYNIALGKKRAQKIKSFFSERGINEKRLSIVSYGESKPLVEGMDKYALQKNRTGVIVLKNPDKP